MPRADRLLDPHELADLLGFSLWWAQREAHRYIPCTRVGRQRRYKASDIWKYIEANTEQPTRGSLR